MDARGSTSCCDGKIDWGLGGNDVVVVMERLRQIQYWVPQRCRRTTAANLFLNHPTKTMSPWTSHGSENPRIVSFNCSLRDECLNVHGFLSLEDADEKIEQWWQEYHQYRPHSSLNNRTPEEFVRSLQKTEDL
jgi:putative transposase